MCKEALQTALFLDRLTMVTRDGNIATGYEHWMGNVPNFASKLHTWGEAVFVKERTKIMPKIGDSGVT